MWLGWFRAKTLLFDPAQRGIAYFAKQLKHNSRTFEFI